MEVWHIYIIIALAFVVAEIFSSYFYAVCFAAGAVAAAISAAAGAGVAAQLLIFVVFTVIGFFTVRPILKHRLQKNKRRCAKMHPELLLGHRAVVSTTVDEKEKGAISIYGLDWHAVSESGEVLRRGEHVIIVRASFKALTVKRI